MVGLPADCCVVVGLGASVTVVIAWGKRPVPFRTRKLRLTAPMVLQPGGCGRVGHRRTHFEGEGPNEYASLLDQVVQAERECLVGAFTHLTHQALACNECEREERRIIEIGVAAAEVFLPFQSMLDVFCSHVL